MLALAFAITALSVGFFTYSISAEGTTTSATIVDTGGLVADSVTVEFRTSEGRSLRAKVPKSEVSGSRIGDVVHIRYQGEDVMGSGPLAMVMNTIMTIIFAFGAVNLTWLAYRHRRPRPSPEPTPPDREIDAEIVDPAPSHDEHPVRARTTRRPGKALAALSVAGAALIAYRRLSKRRPK
ncbi:hypothetical protein ACFVH6_13690 [Spirillospora sp. NPDC127200]